MRLVFNWNVFGSYQYTSVAEDFQGFLWMYYLEKAFIGNVCIKKGESAHLALRICSPSFSLAMMLTLKDMVLEKALPHSFTRKKLYMLCVVLCRPPAIAL